MCTAEMRSASCGLWAVPGGVDVRVGSGQDARGGRNALRCSALRITRNEHQGEATPMIIATDVIDTDYVIVGAGSAGCVLAARLSEDPSTSVTLLEAGGEDRNMWIHIPLGYGRTITDQRVNWCYETEPDPNVNNRKIFWPRGKVLGGSSSINGLVYIRGQAEDFDHWRQLGNTGWSFDDV